MNESTEILIRELADKLGTTADHLWLVLVRQAPISGTVDLLLTVGMMVFLVLAFRFLQKKTTVPPKSESDAYPSAEWEREGAFIAWLCWIIILIVMVLVMIGSLSTTIAALINPEYWALKQLLP